MVTDEIEIAGIVVTATDPVTTWLAGKLETDTAAPTVTVTFSRADRLFASSATVTVLPTVTVAATELLITGCDNVTTAGVSVRLRYISLMVEGIKGLRD
jgi:hypothetical protein